MSFVEWSACLIDKKDDIYIFTDEIADILDLGSVSSAANICWKGKLRSAKKLEGRWGARLSEVMKYRALIARRHANADIRASRAKGHRPSAPGWNRKADLSLIDDSPDAMFEVPEELIGKRQIAGLLGYSTMRPVIKLPNDGVYKSARKLGRVWVADRAEVSRYRDGIKATEEETEATAAAVDGVGEIPTGYISSTEAAEILGVKHYVVADYCRKGLLPHKKRGALLYVLR